MEIYTTDLLTEPQMKEFTSFVEREIGVDYEINEDGNEGATQFTVIVLDLEGNEISMLREKEKQL